MNDQGRQKLGVVCGQVQMLARVGVIGCFVGLGLSGCGTSANIAWPQNIQMPSGLLSKTEQKAAIADMEKRSEERTADATREIERSQ